MSDFRLWGPSVPEASLVPLKYCADWIFAAGVRGSKTGRGIPSQAEHHFKTVAGRGQAVLRGGWGAELTELVQRGPVVCLSAVGVMHSTYTTPLRMNTVETHTDIKCYI